MRARVNKIKEIYEKLNLAQHLRLRILRDSKNQPSERVNCIGFQICLAYNNHFRNHVFIALQTMGGTFSGKQQDCTKGIYALSGWYLMYPFNSTKQMS